MLDRFIVPGLAARRAAGARRAAAVRGARPRGGRPRARRRAPTSAARGLDRPGLVPEHAGAGGRRARRARVLGAGAGRACGRVRPCARPGRREDPLRRRDRGRVPAGRGGRRVRGRLPRRRRAVQGHRRAAPSDPSCRRCDRASTCTASSTCSPRRSSPGRTGWARTTSAALLAEEDPAAFAVNPEGLEVTAGGFAGARRIDGGRASCSWHTGSCSFSEPVEDLQALAPADSLPARWTRPRLRRRRRRGSSAAARSRPRELADHYLERIERLDPHLNAYRSCSASARGRRPTRPTRGRGPATAAAARRAGGDQGRLDVAGDFTGVRQRGARPRPRRTPRSCAGCGRPGR